MSQVKILFHAQCFDGFSSAAIFTQFYRQCVDSNAEFTYESLQHGTEDQVLPQGLDADVNCIVDFRYVADDRLHWWFDHHRTAFLDAGDQTHFEDRKTGQHFWDAAEPSCAGFMARVLTQEKNFDAAPMADLIQWADYIDSAQYPDPKTVVDLDEPALQLMSVLEHLTDPDLMRRTIDGLIHSTVRDVAMWPEMQTRFASIKAKHDAALDTVRSRARLLADVVFVDMTGVSGPIYNKWFPYYLHPESTYVVVVTQGASRVRVYVGANPWRREQRRHNIADICAQYGGGGHSVVGGVNLPLGHEMEARAIAEEIAVYLAASAT